MNSMKSLYYLYHASEEVARVSSYILGSDARMTGPAGKYSSASLQVNNPTRFAQPENQVPGVSIVLLTMGA